MTTNHIFPANALARTVAVTASPLASTALPNIGNILRAVNIGTEVAYIAVGVDEQTAKVADSTASDSACPVLPNSDITLSLDASAINNISTICASGTTTIVVQVGEGM